MSPVRQTFFALTSLAVVSLATACGGAIDSPRGDQIDPNAPGSGGGAGGVVGTCTAAPSCDPGDSRVSSSPRHPMRNVARPSMADRGGAGAASMFCLSRLHPRTACFPFDLAKTPMEILSPAADDASGRFLRSKVFHIAKPTVTS